MKILLGLLAGSKESPSVAPAAVMAAVQGITVTQGDGGKTGDFQQGFQIVLRAERSTRATADYQLFSESPLGIGSRVIVTVTLNAQPRVLIDGIIAHRQLSPASAAGTPSVTLSGKDISVLMDLEEKDKNHAGLGDKEIVQAILGEYARYGIEPEVSDPATTWTATEDERVPKQVATDRAYLQQLAAQHSFIFRIKPGPTPKKNIGYWGPLEYASTAQRALTTNLGAATNVASLEFTDDALAPTQVFGAVNNNDADETTAIKIAKTSSATSLSKTSRLDEEFVRTLRLVYSGPNATQARALAQSIADHSAARALTVQGVLDTFRYGDLLMAPGIVGVRGAGAKYDGNYYIRKVTHEISRGEYKQRFVLTREGPGSTTQRVEV